jgi:hypothetical protein
MEPGRKATCFYSIREEKSQILFYLWKVENRTLTTVKYGANNPKWSDGKKIILIKYFITRTKKKDSILNKSYSAPTWTMEKPGFKKNEHLIANSSKPDPNGSLSQIRAYLDKNTVDKKAIVLNKLNFQNESSISSEMNFNFF